MKNPDKPKEEQTEFGFMKKIENVEIKDSIKEEAPNGRITGSCVFSFEVSGEKYTVNCTYKKENGKEIVSFFHTIVGAPEVPQELIPIIEDEAKKNFKQTEVKRKSQEVEQKEIDDYEEARKKRLDEWFLK